MELITWSDELKLGIPSIDQQHRAMVDIVNRVHRALEEGMGHDFIVQILDELINDTLAHFKYEEELFEKYGYQETEEHKDTHGKLVEQVATLRSTMNEGGYTINAEVMTFLEYWATFHILKTDAAYVDFLISKGVK